MPKQSYPNYPEFAVNLVKRVLKCDEEKASWVISLFPEGFEFGIASADEHAQVIRQADLLYETVKANPEAVVAELVKGGMTEQEARAEVMDYYPFALSQH